MYMQKFLDVHAEKTGCFPYFSRKQSGHCGLRCEDGEATPKQCKSIAPSGKSIAQTYKSSERATKALQGSLKQRRGWAYRSRAMTKSE